MKKIIIPVMLLAAAALASCNKFLDETPDNRTELTDPDKYTSLLVSAYPEYTWLVMAEMSSDNYTDNGPNFRNDYILVEQLYHWKPVTEINQDTPLNLWIACYKAIASANHVIEAIEENGQQEECAAQLGEAYMCRAYNHFLLASMFCQRYSADSGDQHLGIPYVTKPETVVFQDYERGTIAETYELINEDIEAGLPLINDGLYKQPKYHFNRNAAYAFAARFNLFYENYEKALEYANEVLGNDPSNKLRDMDAVNAVTQGDDIVNMWIKPELECNLMLIQYISWLDRMTTGASPNRRFCHNKAKNDNETYGSAGPWGGNLPAFRTWKYTSQGTFIPKLGELFEFNDIVAQTGLGHIVNVAFTMEEVLFIRAEASVMLNDFATALSDLNIWYKARGSKKVVADKDIRDFYKLDAGDRGRYNVAPLYPDFLITPEQEPYIRAVLHAKRVEFVQEGLRWLDIKRWGIEVEHAIGVDGDSDILTNDDLRRAIQLPGEVISAGMEPNPRED